jgi:hypothetical protein
MVRCTRKNGRRKTEIVNHTKLSPLSFVKFTGTPLGIACSNISIWPCLAASKSFPAKAISSGGMALAWEGSAMALDGAGV